MSQTFIETTKNLKTYRDIMNIHARNSKNPTKMCKEPLK